MKTVLFQKEQESSTVSLKDMRSDRVYIAKGNDKTNITFFVLKHEPSDDNFLTGWIFRYWDSECGMCGFHKTMQDAVEIGAKYIETLKEFDSLQEAAKWIKTQTLNE